MLGSLIINNAQWPTQAWLLTWGWVAWNLLSPTELRWYGHNDTPHGYCRTCLARPPHKKLQDRWSLVTSSVILKCRPLWQKCVSKMSVKTGGLMAVVSQDRCHHTKKWPIPPSPPQKKQKKMWQLRGIVPKVSSKCKFISRGKILWTLNPVSSAHGATGMSGFTGTQAIFSGLSPHAAWSFPRVYVVYRSAQTRSRPVPAL